MDGNDIHLESQDRIVRGRCGGSAIGFDVNVIFSAGKASGRLGGDVIGMDVAAEINGVEPILAAAIFVIAYYMYKANHRNRGSGGGGGGN